jgi:hypothetical protein
MTWASLPPIILAGIGEYSSAPPQPTANAAVFLVAPLAVGAVLLGYVFSRGEAPRRRIAILWALSTLLAMPAVLVAMGYVRVLGLDEQPWFCEFRAASGSEYLSAGAGLVVGMVIAWLGKRRFLFAPSAGFLCCLLAILLAVPYTKQWLAPGDFSFWKDEWDAEVCRQTTGSSCGPASAATVAHACGVQAAERDFITECHTTAGGTENWYLARALRARGLTVRYLKLDAPIAHLPYPAIAGTRSGCGHFITVLGEQGDHYKLGDPLTGPFDYPKAQVNGGRIVFTGFFMVVSAPETIPAPRL